MDAVRVENLTKIYRLPGFFRSNNIPGVKGLNLNVREGEIFGLLGLNGSGKTTTLRLLVGLMRPTAGTLMVLGRPVADDPDVRSELGYLPESVSFAPALTPRETLRFFARIDPARFSAPAQREERIREVLEVSGLIHASDRRVGGFSKGMLQRLGVAQAILHHPNILVLDEPASGLDPLGIAEMRELFLKLNREMGMTILFSSHSIGEVEKISHRVALIAANRLEAVLERAQWQEPPAPSLEEQFLGMARRVVAERELAVAGINHKRSLK